MARDNSSRQRKTIGGTRMRTACSILSAGLLVATVVGCSGSGSTDATTKAQETTTSRPSSSTTMPPEQREPIVIAHRGASAEAPEHTIASYDLAIEQGADYIEQDLQLTADGELVVFHDPVLGRIARGPAASCSGLIAEKTLAQLGDCDVGSWFNDAYPELSDPAYVGLRIPTMAEVLERYGPDVQYYIELKAVAAGSGMEEPLIELLDEAGLLGSTDQGRPVIVQSFGPDVLRTVHELEPDLPLVLLLPNTGETVASTTLDAASEYAVGVGPAAVLVDGALVAAAHERCLEVHPYTVDEPAEMTRLLDAGVDGMFTNSPETLRPLVEGRAALDSNCTSTSEG